MEKTETTKKTYFVKQTTRDIIFRKGFASEKNLPEIYHSLFPDDLDWEKHHYIRISIKTFLENSLSNDLSFLVVKENTPNSLICLEAQTTWALKYLTRFGNYIVLAYGDAIKEILNFNPIETPTYLYVLFVGTRGNPKINYKTYQKDKKTQHTGIKPLDVKVLSKNNKNIPNTRVFNEYTRFCDLYVEIIDKYGRTREALKKLADECIREGIYVEIFTTRRKEFMSDYTILLDQQMIFQEQEKEINTLKNENKVQKEEINTLETKNKVQKEEFSEKINSLENKNRQLIEQLKKHGLVPVTE